MCECKLFNQTDITKIKRKTKKSTANLCKTKQNQNKQHVLMVLVAYRNRFM